MNILDVKLVKNAIYVCSLVTSMGDNLHTFVIVNDWIFDANFQRAIKLEQKGLDNAAKIILQKQHM